MKRSKTTTEERKAESSPKSKDRTPQIVDIDEAPPFLIDNLYLRRGYRKNFRSISSIFRSLFMAHNETMNIWTHFFGSLCLIWAMYYLTNVSMAHRSVEAHFKELFYKREDFSSHLEAVSKRLQGCQSVSSSTSVIHNSAEVSVNHLCSYINAIQTQEFDHSFFSIHGVLTKSRKSTDAVDGPVQKLKQMILRAVDSRDAAPP